MPITNQIVKCTAEAALGLFAGAMLLIALALVPYWQSLSGESYRVSFQAIGPYLGAFMVPLMFSAISLSGVATLARSPSRLRAVAIFVLVALIVPLYLLFSAPINAQLLGNAPIPEPMLIELRGQWFFWHWTRTIVGLVAFLLSVFGFRS